MGMMQQMVEMVRGRAGAALRRLLPALGVGLASLAGVADASTIFALPERELTQQADAVVFGVVISTRVLGNERYISTEADIQVYESVKGPPRGSLVKVQMPGGVWNGLFASVPGSVTLKEGQMWIGFLNHHEGVTYTAWGMGFGMLPVHRAPRGGLVVGRNGYDAMVAAPEGANVEGMLHLADTPLNEYLARLRGHLREGGVDPVDPGTGPFTPGGR
jgi:hypothetical protein